MPAAKKYEAIHVENEGGITWLMINRPDKRNAMSPQVHLEMDETLDELAVDPATEVLVLTGAGNAFSAGQDIKLYFRANAGDAAARHNCAAPRTIGAGRSCRHSRSRPSPWSTAIVLAAPSPR
jgi:enoyl-CoA hydratase/carnithine racemase